MNTEENGKTIIFSSYPNREVSFSHKIMEDGKFFVNILDEQGQAKYQGYFTIDSFLKRVTKDFTDL